MTEFFLWLRKRGRCYQGLQLRDTFIDGAAVGLQQGPNHWLHSQADRIRLGPTQFGSTGRNLIAASQRESLVFLNDVTADRSGRRISEVYRGIFQPNDGKLIKRCFPVQM